MRGIGLILIALGVGLSGSSLSLAKGPGMEGGIVFKFGPDITASDWRYVSFPRRPGADFVPRGEDAVEVRTKAGVGILWHPVPPWGSNASMARWRWRVMEGVGPTDLTKKGGDDRALAVYFAFADGNPDQTDLIDLLRQGRGYVLMYVWGGTAQRGTILSLPYFDGHGRTVVKRAASAPDGVWFSEAVNVRDDFRYAFWRAPGKLVAVALSSDSDDTGDVNLAAVADLCIK